MAQARRSRPISPRRASEEGYTLVEVMVAMLLTSIMVTSVFSVALTVKTGGGKGESKIKAAAMTRQVAAVLKNYVTAETGTASTAAPFAGPCGGAANNWSMTCNGVVDACPLGGSSCYALANGTHTLTGINPAFEAAIPAGRGARTSYFVDGSIVVNGRPVPVVVITTTWTDP